MDKENSLAEKVAKAREQRQFRWRVGLGIRMCDQLHGVAFDPDAPAFSPDDAVLRARAGMGILEQTVPFSSLEWAKQALLSPQWRLAEDGFLELKLEKSFSNREAENIPDDIDVAANQILAAEVPGNEGLQIPIGLYRREGSAFLRMRPEAIALLPLIQQGLRDGVTR
jgi:hypothetical protein